MQKPVYSVDFETVVDPNETRVWLWGKCDIDCTTFVYGTDIDSFMEEISTVDCKAYFHNIKFDVQFMFYWLFHNGYRHTSERKPKEGYFSTLISDMGMFYTCTVHFFNGSVVEFIDSYKLITLPVRDIPKAFGLDVHKLDLDYAENRDFNHVPTDEEISYVKADVEIVAKGIKAMHENGLIKMTAASNALYNYKKVLSNKEFKRRFPPIEYAVDKDCRKSYKGGWTYLNEAYQGMMVGEGQVYDVNSMYPWAMKYCMLPFGNPYYYDGEYKPDEFYPLYIQCLQCCFSLKKGHYPSIQLKNSFRFSSTEYIKESGDDPVILHLTSVDLKLLFDNYDVWDITYIGGYKFRGETGLFSEYIDYWYDVKQKAKVEGNKAMYHIAKLMLNSLYGKFGSNPEKASKYPYLDETDDIVKYRRLMPEIGSGGYIPVAAFITSYARDKIIRAANACGDRFIYADTDSVHVVGREKVDLDIDNYRLGAFKLEGEFTRAKYHRAKCYIEEFDGELDKKCAGLPVSARHLFNFDTMEPGQIFEGKLVPKNIKGGVVLVERPFQIKG